MNCNYVSLNVAACTQWVLEFLRKDEHWQGPANSRRTWINLIKLFQTDLKKKIEQLRTWTRVQSADWVNREGLAPGSNNSPTAPTLSNSNPGLLEYVSLKILEQHHPYQQSPLPPWLSSWWSPSWFTNGTTITPTISAPQAPMCARLVFLSLTNFHKRSHSFFSSSP